MLARLTRIARLRSNLIYTAQHSSILPQSSGCICNKHGDFPHSIRRGHTFSGVQCGERSLDVSWDDGVKSRYPYLFLRESCKCGECFEPSSHSRILDIFCDMYNIDASLAKYEEGNEHELLLTWGDGHQSVYHVDWLRKATLPEKHNADEYEKIEYRADDIVHKDLVIWDHDQLHDNIPTFDFGTLMKDDKTLFDALYSLYQYGLILLDRGPTEVDIHKTLARRIGFLRATNYGEYFDVKTKSNPSNIAYTEGPLPFHVDLLYFTMVPDVQILHCIQQVPEGKGGENVFSNAFKAAIDLLKEKPDYFEILARMNINFRDVGEDWPGKFSLGYRRPICELNKNGRLFSVNVNNFSRADLFDDMTVDECLAFYEAYRELGRKLYDQHYYVEHRLRDGQAIVFHNTRVLHARRALVPGHERLLQGHYYEWDIIFSKLRVLQEELGLTTPKLYPFTNDMF